MLILAIGDVIGKPGRQTVQKYSAVCDSNISWTWSLPTQKMPPGTGFDNKHGQKLLDAGVDILTSGNHIWTQKESYLSRWRFAHPASVKISREYRAEMLTRDTCGGQSDRPHLLCQ
jgi:calcineurin-like phosphoesterase